MFTRSFFCSVLIAAAGCFAAEEPAPPAHDHTAPAGAVEGVPEVKEADFLKPGEGEKAVHITVAAAFNEVNGGMNFNGWSHGKSRYIVPVGWKVTVTFVNRSPVPHSALIVETPMVKKLRVGDPYFEGAGVVEPEKGMALKAETFTFTASEAGEFALACGFPSHALAGHWIGFEVSEDNTEPVLIVGDGEPIKMVP